MPGCVSEVRGQWFKNCGIVSVTIPAGVREIGDAAFYGCAALRHVTLNEGLARLGGSDIFGQGAFQHSGIEEIVIPATVTEIGCNAFRGCASLRSVRFRKDSQLRRIGENCFRESGLTEIALPDGVEEVGAGAFYECARLERVRLNDGLRVLGRCEGYDCGAFQRCGLREVAVPSSLVEMGSNTFKGCGELGSVTLSGDSRLRVVGVGAFADTKLGPSGVRFPENAEVSPEAFRCDWL